MRRLLLLVAFAGILAPAHAQVLCVQCFDQNDSIGLNVGADNLIMNGGFENTTCGTGCVGVYCPASASHNCDITGWMCTGGGSATYGCVYDSAHYMVIEKARAVYFGNSYANPCSGTLSGTFPNNDSTCITHGGCEVQGIHGSYPLSGPTYGGANGLSLSQTVNGLVPGNTYVLEFWAGGEYEGWFFRDGIFAVDVGFGKIYLTCRITHQPPDVGTRYLIQFAATAPSQTITFTNWGHVCGTCTELVLDDVRLYDAIHLPATVNLCTTGITDPPAQQAKVVADATNELLSITVGNDEPSHLSIYDMAARKLIDRPFTSNTSVRTDQLPRGAYAYIIRNGATITRGKFTTN